MKLCRIQLFAKLIIPLLFYSCDQNNDTLLEPGVSHELALSRKAKVDNIVYDLFFDIPPDKREPIRGLVDIQFSLSNTDQPLVLDFNAPASKIKSIIVNNEPVEVIWKQEHLLIPSDYLKPSNEIKIDFEAGDQSLNRKDDYLFTLFVPARASTSFPLFDQPDLKARYNLSLSVPRSWKAVANGSEKSKQEANGKTIYIFKETKPISSYLFSFVAGDFQVRTKKIGDRLMHMYHRETDSIKVADNLDVLFDWHLKSLEWMEEYTGLQLPFQKLDFVLIPSFQYSGMEHPGAILYNASSLLLDRSSTLKQQLNRARLIAHETAHMWFGNLVTMKWFDDVWLKEVFANLMASKIVNPGFPDVNHDLQFLLAHYPGAYSVDRTLGTHAIQQPLDNLKNAGTLYGTIIYKKAPIVMRMLEESVGEKVFRNGIREYLKRYSFGNASWDDLISILAKDASFNIEEWNTHWVKTPGMPEVSYRLVSNDDKMIDKFDLWLGNREMNKDQWWKQDLSVLLGYSDSSYRLPAKMLTEPKTFDLSGRYFPEYLFLNSNGKGYGYFLMRGDSKAHFLRKIDEHADPVLRASVWISLYESMLRHQLPPKKLMDHALESLLKEDEALIAEYITEIIKTVFWRFYTEEERVSISPRLEGLLLNLVMHAPTVNLKATYFNALKSMAISDHGVLILEKVWRQELALDGLPLSEKDMTTLSYELAVRSVDGYQEILQQQSHNISNPERKKKFDFIRPALASDSSIRDKFFESLKDVENRANEAWVLEALSYLHHPLRARDAVKYINPSLEMLEEIQLTGDIFFPKGWIDMTLNGHSSEEAENQVKQFLYRHNDYSPRLKKKILQSVDILSRSAENKRNER